MLYITVYILYVYLLYVYTYSYRYKELILNKKILYSIFFLYIHDKDFIKKIIKKCFKCYPLDLYKYDHLLFMIKSYRSKKISKRNL